MSMCPHDPAPSAQLVTFRAKAGVAPETVAAALERIEREYYSTLPTYLGRDIRQRPDGTWAEVLYSTTLEAARALCAGWVEQPCTRAILDLVDPGTVRETFLVPASA